MIRTIIWYLYFGISLALTLPALLRAAWHNRRGDEQGAKAIAVKKARSWARQLVWLAGGKIEVKGAEHIPKDEPFLLVANHQSNFDIPILLGYLNVPVAFVSKLEMMKMPVVSTWMVYLKCLFIDRGNFRKSIKTINEGAKNLKSGDSYVIFPEGTRSEDGTLGDFKAGSIKMATKSGVKILPVTINGSIGMMRKGEKIIRPASVTVRIHEAIPADLESTQLMLKVKSQIETGLDMR